jgi:RNA-directed DNA polymerase
MGRHPQINQRVARLLKRQQRKCAVCHLFFKDRDLLEIDHFIPCAQGGKDEIKNLQILHSHCHDVKSANNSR